MFSVVGRVNNFLFDEEDSNEIPAPFFIPDPNDDLIVNVSDLKRDYFRRKLVEKNLLDFHEERLYGLGVDWAQPIIDFYLFVESPYVVVKTIRIFHA